ncbi:hypothetical protein Efla_000339 [Eimeria flavescens]
MDYYGGPPALGPPGTQADVYMRVGGPPAFVGNPLGEAIELKGPRSPGALRQQLLQEALGAPKVAETADRGDSPCATEAERLWRLWLAKHPSTLKALAAYLKTHAMPHDHPTGAAAVTQQQQQQQQHAAAHRVASSVPVFLDASELLEQQPFLGRLLLLLPQQTLQLLNQKVLPAICMRLLQLQQQQELQQLQRQQQELLPPQSPLKQQEAEQQQQELQQLHLLQQTALHAAPPLRRQQIEGCLLRCSHLTVGDVGNLLTLKGRVVRAGRVQMLTSRRVFCCRACGFRFVAEAEPELFYRLRLPTRCPSCDAATAAAAAAAHSKKNWGFGFKRGSLKVKSTRCTGDIFDESAEEFSKADYQEIRQAMLACCSGVWASRAGFSRNLPAVVLFGDLAGRVSCGDLVSVVGVAVCRWERLRKDCRPCLEVFVEASSIEVMCPLNSAFAAAAPLPSHIAQLLLPQHLALRHFASCNSSSCSSSSSRGEASCCSLETVSAPAAASAAECAAAAGGSAVTVSELFDGLWGVVRTPHFAAFPNGGRLQVLRKQLLQEATSSSSSSSSSSRVLDDWGVREAIVNAACPQLTGIPVAVLALLLAMLGGCESSASPAAGEQREALKQSRWGRYQRQDSSSSSSGAAAEAAADANNTSSNSSSSSSSSSTSGDSRLQRHSIHLLLLGDPSTGKSQLLRAAARLSTHAVSASGFGCSAAGLTCAAVRDSPAEGGGEWALEGGALVLADGGVCCLDDLSALKKDVQQTILEAMEQQSVSVAKAGMVCTLKSRCSVFAAAHAAVDTPEAAAAAAAAAELADTAFGSSRAALPAVASGLSAPLLSRFDLIVVLPESASAALDVVETLLSTAVIPGSSACVASRSTAAAVAAGAAAAGAAAGAAAAAEALAVVWLMEMALGGRQVTPGAADKSQQALLLPSEGEAVDSRRGLLSLHAAAVKQVICELSSRNASSSSNESSLTLRCLIRSEREYLLVQDLLLETLGVSLPPPAVAAAAAAAAGDGVSAAAAAEEALLIPRSKAEVTATQQQQQQQSPILPAAACALQQANYLAAEGGCIQTHASASFFEKQKSLNLNFAGLPSSRRRRPWASSRFPAAAAAAPAADAAAFPRLLPYACDAAAQQQQQQQQWQQQQQRAPWG